MFIRIHLRFDVVFSMKNPQLLSKELRFNVEDRQVQHIFERNTTSAARFHDFDLELRVSCLVILLKVTVITFLKPRHSI